MDSIQQIKILSRWLDKGHCDNDIDEVKYVE